MAECLIRGFNVAVPEVDIGDDLFVINDRSGNYRRIQVKTVTAIRRQAGYSAQFQVPLAQLEQVFTPDLIYVFVARFHSGWGPFIVLQRDTLAGLHQLRALGSRQKNDTMLQLYLSYSTDGSVRCSGQSLTAFISQFTDLPDLLPDELA